MKQKLKSILSAALAVVMALSLAACGSGSKDIEDLAKSKGPIYLSDLLEAGGRRIWYYTDKTFVGKDTEISNVLVFESGEITMYEIDSSDDSQLKTFGDASKLTDDEIIELLKQVDAQKDAASIAGLSSRLDGIPKTEQAYIERIDEMFLEYDNDPWWIFEDLIYDLANEASDISGDTSFWDEMNRFEEQMYTNGLDWDYMQFLRDLAQKCATIIVSSGVEGYEAALAYCTNGVDRPDRSTSSYTLNVITDNTGNNTSSEKIIFTYQQYITPAKIYMDGYLVETIYLFELAEELYTETEKAIEVHYYGGDYEVYDALFGGFVVDGGTSMIVTKLSEPLYDGMGVKSSGNPQLDTPDADGVIVD